MREVALRSRGKAVGGNAGGRGPDPGRYWAFLSYSHKDGAVADWLHGALETYRVPRSLVGREAAVGPIPASLAPIFRDRHELAASGDLGHTIREALAESRCLIVLCSPDAAQSRWTNEEILAFKKLRPDGTVLAAIVAGEPFASELPGREADECFPPALRQAYDKRGRPTARRAEPIAADLRDNKDGKRLGLLKIVAGMLGVGLDDLVQREQNRRQKRLTYIAAASLAGMALTSGLAVFAFDQRDAARDQRREAEGLVGFMLGDLRDKLDPIGRLDALDAVGTRALEYFEKQDKSELSDAALAQRSKALTLMGEIASKRGDLDGALRRYREAWAGTAEAMRRRPDDAQRIFDHAQNVFWVGSIDYQRGRHSQAESAWREYKTLAEQLVTIDPAKKEWRLERIYADTNLGIVLIKLNRFREASATFARGLRDAESLASAEPRNRAYQDQVSEALAWLSEALEKDGRLDESLGHRERQLALLEQLAERSGLDAPMRKKVMVAHRALGRLFAARGDRAAGLHHFATSIRIADELMQTEPENTDWAETAAATYIDLGELQLATGEAEGAAASARGGCNIANRLVERDATVVAWRSVLRGECLQLRVRLALSQGVIDEARALSARAVALARDEAGRSSSLDSKFILASAHFLRGQVAQAMNDDPLAKRSFEAALTALPRNVQLTPRRLAQKALMLDRLGRRQEAARIEAQLIAMGYRHPIFVHDRRVMKG